ncbi:MAG: hypothetical protein ACYC27_11775 [Armatimonadota bacterium]
MALNKEHAEQWNSVDLIELARWQRYVLWLLLLQVVLIIGYILIPLSSYFEMNKAIYLVIDKFAIVSPILSVVTILLSAFCIYKLANALRKSLPVIYGILMITFFFNLVILWIVIGESTDILKKNGIRVGLMGANSVDLEKVRS